MEKIISFKYRILGTPKRECERLRRYYENQSRICFKFIFNLIQNISHNIEDIKPWSVREYECSYEGAEWNNGTVKFSIDKLTLDVSTGDITLTSSTDVKSLKQEIKKEKDKLISYLNEIEKINNLVGAI